MPAKRVKVNAEEKLDPANLDKVIKLLEPTEVGVKPCTKKDACAILNISYNTARLGTIIENYKEKCAKDAERRTAKRGTPATKDEVAYVIQEYLQKATIDSISKSTFRGVTFIKYILESNGVPTRAASHDYFKPELIPDAATRTEFKLGEKVYSARYDCLAEIRGVYPGKNAYRLWLLGEDNSQFAFQPAEELASLDHIRALGVKL